MWYNRSRFARTGPCTDRGKAVLCSGFATHALIAAAVVIFGATTVHAEDRRTGYDDMSPELQAMQDDVMGNPGIFVVMAGETLFDTPMGTANTACSDCHDRGDMAGAAARYPAWDATAGRAVDLTGRVDLCRVRHQGADPYTPEESDQLAILSYLQSLSKGMPITPSLGAEMDDVRAQGEALFSQRMGQLNLSCAQCHDDRAGGHLRAALIPEAHATGYPQYRLEWESVGTLERRLGNCMTGVRAARFAPGSPEIVSLTAYLMERAAGLALESPAVRP